MEEHTIRTSDLVGEQRIEESDRKVRTAPASFRMLWWWTVKTCSEFWEMEKKTSATVIQFRLEFLEERNLFFLIYFLAQPGKSEHQ